MYMCIYIYIYKYKYILTLYAFEKMSCIYMKLKTTQHTECSNLTKARWA